MPCPDRRRGGGGRSFADAHDAPALPDGGFLIGQEYRVWRVDPQGRIHAAAGTGKEGHSGDGGPAVRARVLPSQLAALPATPLDRPQRLLLAVATPDGRAAYDALRLFPPHWLPTETARLVAAGVLKHATRLEHCRRLSARRVDCSLTARGDRCAVAAVAFSGGRLRWGRPPCSRSGGVHLRPSR